MNARNVESLLSNITSRFITDDEDQVLDKSVVLKRGYTNKMLSFGIHLILPQLKVTLKGQYTQK